MEIVVGGKLLHHGKSTVYVDIETDDPRSDTMLILRGEVVPKTLPIEIDGALLGR